MSEKKCISGPYRATKLWNDAVRTFYNGMPLSRHWRGLRHYDNCFTASEGINWLHNHLKNNPNFGSSVSRDQTTKLLRKFVKAGLIEDVRGSSIQSDFKDNRQLYWFSNKSPLKALRTPRTPGRVVFGKVNLNIQNHGESPILKKRWNSSSKQSQENAEDANVPRGHSSRVNVLKKSNEAFGENAANEARDTCGMQECHVLMKPPTTEERNQTWKEVYLDKLNTLSNRILFGDVSTLINPDLVNAEFLHHNMTQITTRGVVQAPEGHPDDLPSWMLTAMKCMANWPNPADISCNIPSYPGVERDVFKIVRDFFTNLVVPLIPFDLYDAVIRLYIGAEFLDITYRSSPDREGKGKCEKQDFDEESSSLEPGDSVENLILNMSISSTQKTSTPYVDDTSYFSHKRDPFDSKIQNSREEDFRRNNGANFHTPSHRYHHEVKSLINPESLKLCRLKNYTDFKEENLYPTLLEGTCDNTVPGACSNSFEKSRTCSQLDRVLCDSLFLKQADTVRSVKTNDLVRRLKRECQGTSFEKRGVIRSDEIEGVSLPQNCCFETAFTTDSPKTRIIPQKSVDTVHLREYDKSKLDIRPRPMSIAVTSLVGLDNLSKNNTWKRKQDEMDREMDLHDDVFTEDNGKSSTPQIHSPLSRSKSVGNFQRLDEFSTSLKLRESPVLNYVPYRSVASRLLDSLKNKNVKSTLAFQKRTVPSKNDHIGNDFENRIQHLQKELGGYTNPILSVSPANVKKGQVPGSCNSIKQHESGVGHLRTKSGGFLNLALVSSSNSLDHAEYLDVGSFTPTNQSELSFEDGSHCSLPKCLNSECRNVSLPAAANRSISRITAPDGCLSHILSSASSTSSGQSIYYSAQSQSSRNSTPRLLCHAVPQRNLSSMSYRKESLSSATAIENKGNPAPVIDVDLSKHLSSSANELSDVWVDRTPYGKAPPYAQGGVWRHYHSSPSKRLIGRKKGIENFLGSKACLPGLLTREGKEAAMNSMQLLLLMLNPVDRRKLHLLLRMMNKISNNEKLNISDKQTTRAMVLNTFTRSILLCGKEADYDELLSLRIVSFMMDNHEEIMHPPQEIAVLVHRKLTRMHRSQVSQVQYERQRMTGSQQFLIQLLDQIITDKKLTNKEKRKKLKEFKSLYPEVYKERFPKGEQEKVDSRSSIMKNFMKFSSLTSLKSRTLRL